LPRRRDNFQSANYVPNFGDVVHLNWAPAIGHEMQGPHYGLVLSSHTSNHATGMAIVIPITLKGGKISGAEVPVQVGRVQGVAIISAMRSVDYTVRDIQYETQAPATAKEANRRIRLFMPNR
jgi:mRNA-degrading endonuclease toxin of MazEF toxin-antitoxin module